MARFHVGQRVRIVSDEYHGEAENPRGIEAVVTGIGSFIGPYSGIDYTYKVNAGDRPILVNSHEIEPITDSNELVSWESMRDLWVPEHLRIKA